MYLAKLLAFASLPVLLSLPGQATLSINPTYLDSAGETWDPTSRGVVEQAISEWLAVLDSINPSDDHQIDITFDFTNAGATGYLGQWQGSSSGLFAGDNRLPWENTTHIIHFNADRFDDSQPNYSWWDPTPADDGSDQPFEAWDLLSVARHEIGHALGFTSFYAYDLATASEFYPWESLITNVGPDAIFDLGGLNVTLASPTDVAHVANSGSSLDDLMTPALPNGTRHYISDLNLQMLSLAYGYRIIPEPSVFSLLALGALTTLRRRR